MTEAKRTEEVMEHCKNWIKAYSQIEQYHNPSDRLMQMQTADNYRRDLESAITAIIEERDQAVKYKRQMAERSELYSDELKAIRHTIVSTIGGIDYEGFPTSELNWLQRLRILLEVEKERDALKARVGELIDAIKALSCDGNFVYTDRVRKEARLLVQRIQEAKG